MHNNLKQKITILTPCFNELENIEALAEAIIEVSKNIPEITINHLFIDNASTDGTIQNR